MFSADGGTDDPDTTPSSSGRLRNWWAECGIATQLLIAVNSLCLLLAIIFLSIDYPRQIGRMVDARRESLTEEAIIVHAAIRDMQHHGDEALQQYIDNVCHRISSGDAPGHHIAVRFGDYVLQSRSHGPPSSEMFNAIEQAAASENRRGTFRGKAIVVGAVVDDNLRVYVSEYVDDIRRFVRGDVLARLSRLALLAVVAGLVVNAVLLRFFLSPLDRTIAAVSRIGSGEFGVQIDGATNREFRQLARAVNDMSGSLATAERRRAAQLDKARRIQEHLLPGRSTVDGLCVAWLYEPAEAVAGDYYDHVLLADGSALLWLADVAGHGIPAAMAAAMLKSLLSTAAERCTSAPDVMRFVNRHFCAVTLFETFATAVAVRFPPDGTVIEYVTAGHPAPLLLRREGTIVPLQARGLPLGVDAETGWEHSDYRVTPGDRLLLYTDGVIETFDENETCFGKERLISLLRDQAGSTSDQFVRRLSEVLAGFRGQQAANDDVTAAMIDFEKDTPAT